VLATTLLTVRHYLRHFMAEQISHMMRTATASARSWQVTVVLKCNSARTVQTVKLRAVAVASEPGSSVSIVSGYGLDDRAIEVRSPTEAKEFFL
jgi:hypothetical protein